MNATAPSNSASSALFASSFSAGAYYGFGLLACLFDLTTILGNFLVIFAVIKERYLRSMTNYFIVSLATADLLVGALVMPFAIHQYFIQGQWVFGELWCDLWHALDVLSSTASILNLCSIALDRYWILNSPCLTYSNRMSKRRCVIMLAAVWISSALISFPAIAWWRFTRQKKYANASGSGSGSNGLAERSQCLFTDDSVYLLVSSLISFYFPLLVMLMVYYRIYRTATNLIHSLNAGSKVVFKPGQQGGGGESVVLRIHRGGGTSANYQRNNSFCSPASPYNLLSRSCQNLSGTSGGGGGVVVVGGGGGGGGRGKGGLDITAAHSPVPTAANAGAVTSNRFLTPTYNGGTGSGSSAAARWASNQYLNGGGAQYSARLSFTQDLEPHEMDEEGADVSSMSLSQRLSHKLRAFAMGKKLSKFAREQKAAKTLGVVMGVFIGCWLPFFIGNVLQVALPQWMSSETGAKFMRAATWLGYLNSSVNPIIYARSMRDFRRAFIKLLCGWYLRRQYSQGILMAADDAMLTTTHERPRLSLTPSICSYFRRHSNSADAMMKPAGMLVPAPDSRKSLTSSNVSLFSPHTASSAATGRAVTSTTTDSNTISSRQYLSP